MIGLEYILNPYNLQYIELAANSVVTILPTDDKRDDFTVDEQKVFDKLSNTFYYQVARFLLILVLEKKKF